MKRRTFIQFCMSDDTCKTEAITGDYAIPKGCMAYRYFARTICKIKNVEVVSEPYNYSQWFFLPEALK